MPAKSKPKAPKAPRATKPSAAVSGPSAPGQWQGYSAANQSTGRGYVYFPELNPERELKPQARTAILTKARWVTRNMGIGKRFRDGIAETVGYLTPQPTTSDHDWNNEALQLFNDTMGKRLIFDRAGRENFYERQITLTKLMLQDGDCGLAFAYDEVGNPQTALYQSPQIGRPYFDAWKPNNPWWDGVLVNASGRPEKYSLMNSAMTEVAMEIEAQDFVLFSNPEPGNLRGVSAFACFVDRMLDVREVDNDEMRGIKASNLVGFYLKNSQLQNAQLQAFMEKMQAANKFGSTPTATDPKSYNFEDITRGGGGLAELGLGQEIDTVHDDRRHPNRQELIDYFIRDMSWGVGFPVEVLWSPGKLTGPSVRFMMATAERSANNYRRILKDLYCQRMWGWFISVMIKQGRLRACKDRRFWSCDWLARESMTIDGGRDITSGLAEIRAGGNTYAAYYGEVNQDWRKQFEQSAIERAYAAELETKHKLPPGTLLGQPQVVLNPNQDHSTNQSTGQPQTK